MSFIFAQKNELIIIGLFYRGGLKLNLGEARRVTRSPSVCLFVGILSPSPHHRTILESNNQTKLDCVGTSARGLTAPKIAEATEISVLVPHNFSLFTTSLGMRAMISRVYACMLGLHPHSGDHHAHSTGSGKQRESVRY